MNNDEKQAAPDGGVRSNGGSGMSAANTASRFPDAVAFARTCERYFGRVALKYASNGSGSIGKEPTPGMDWFATTPYRSNK